MVKEVSRRIEIPEGIEVDAANDYVTIKGPRGVLNRRFNYPGVHIIWDNSELVVTARIDRKLQRATVGTFAAHLTNMIKGVTEGFEYRMKVVYSHFPIQLKAAQNELVIANFLGERRSRSARILDGVTLELSKDEVLVKGINKESVGQTMANIEQATKVRGFDIRVFQDGIYLVEKN
ncbi:MAG: 50S ribosomal protein L6 [Methanosarcinales archaeon]|nr:50S ribosomal protein L6 [Methanosarcinales archaeon]